MHVGSIVIASAALVASSVHADTVTARIVADDFFSVYVGNGSGSSMSLVGVSGTNTWQSQGAPVNFEAASGDYIYIAAWDSASFGPPHMLIAEFTIGSTTLYSNTIDWTTKFDSTVKDPSVAQVSALAQSASTWLLPLASMPNGSQPYGNLIGGSPSSMIWHDSFDGTSASENGYALFRTLAPVVAVPEPSTYAMLIAGLGLMVFAARRRAWKGQGVTH